MFDRQNYDRMSYGRNYNDPAKWTFIFLALLIVGGVVLIVIATGTFSSTTAAQSRRMDAETNAYIAKSQLDQQSAQADADARKKLNDALLPIQTDFQVKRNQQDLQNVQQEFENTQNMKQTMTYVGIGLATILSLGILAVLVAWARSLNAQSHANLRNVRELELSNEKIGLMLKNQGQLNEKFIRLQGQLGGVYNLLTQAELLPVESLAKGNGSNGGDKNVITEGPNSNLPLAQ